MCTKTRKTSSRNRKVARGKQAAINICVYVVINRTFYSDSTGGASLEEFSGSESTTMKYFQVDCVTILSSSQSCPWVGLACGLGWVGNGSKICF